MELTFDIPPRPEILLNFSAELEKADPDIRRIELLVEQDVGLAASVMHLANSPLFGGTRKFSSISAAIRYLGLATIGALLTGVALQRALATSTAVAADLDEFWTHSVGFAGELATLVNARSYVNISLMSATAYTYGLFQEAGVALFILSNHSYLGDRARLPSGTDVIEWERTTYGTDHAQLGFMLAEKWGLPPFLSLAIRSHHDVACFDPDSDLPEGARQLVWLGALCEKDDGLRGKTAREHLVSRD